MEVNIVRDDFAPHQPSRRCVRRVSKDDSDGLYACLVEMASRPKINVTFTIGGGDDGEEGLSRGSEGVALMMNR